MEEPTSLYTDEQLKGETVTKKDLITFLQEHASLKFLQENRLKGQLKNIAKTKTKDQLVADYKALFSSKSFKKPGEEEEVVQKPREKKVSESDVTERTKKLSISESSPPAEEPPKYVKKMLKKGDKINFPKKGDTVGCFYTGKLDNGTVFDTNIATKKGKSATPLKFKVGQGKVIRGWDEGLMTMSLGEKAELIIEPEWAYGKKGVEGKVPPNSRLNFEVELVSID